MNWQAFEQIYVDYKEKKYPYDTIESVHRCYKSYDKKEKTLEFASQYRKLSAKEAMNDVIDFFNCLKRCYSGYDYFLSDKKCEDIQKLIERKIRFRIGRINNRELARLLYNVLKDIINDCHFEIYVNGWEYHFSKKYIAYVTDLVVRKVNQGYEVIKDNTYFENGFVIPADDAEKYLMPTIYVADNVSKKDKCFLLGVYSDKELKEISVADRTLVLHRILSDKATAGQAERLKFGTGYVVVNHASYNMPWDEALMDEFYQEGVACSKADHVILNLAGNGGGSSYYPERFYTGLCGVGDNGFSEAVLTAPDELDDCIKEYKLGISMPHDEHECTYKGNLYVVMNKTTGSSAEMAVSSAYNIKNAIVVGSGSFGCSNFGECQLYQLPKSGIMFYCGHKLFHHDRFDEGKGFLPDYWIDDENPVAVLERYLELQ